MAPPHTPSTSSGSILAHQQVLRHIQICGRLIFIHLQCWEVFLFLRIQHQRCITILCPKDPEFYTPLVLNCQKRRNLQALEVYEYQSPKMAQGISGLPYSSSWTSKFGSILGRDRGLVNNCSAAAGRAPNWIGGA